MAKLGSKMAKLRSRMTESEHKMPKLRKIMQRLFWRTSE